MPNRSNWGYLTNVGLCQADYLRVGEVNLSVECTIYGNYSIASGDAQCLGMSCTDASYEQFRGFQLVATSELVYVDPECAAAEEAALLLKAEDSSSSSSSLSSSGLCAPYPLELKWDPLTAELLPDVSTKYVRSALTSSRTLSVWLWESSLSWSL